MIICANIIYTHISAAAADWSKYIHKIRFTTILNDHNTAASAATGKYFSLTRFGFFRMCLCDICAIYVACNRASCTRRVLDFRTLFFRWFGICFKYSIQRERWAYTYVRLCPESTCNSSGTRGFFTAFLRFLFHGKSYLHHNTHSQHWEIICEQNVEQSGTDYLSIMFAHTHPVYCMQRNSYTTT